MFNTQWAPILKYNLRMMGTKNMGLSLIRSIPNNIYPNMDIN